LRSLPLVAALPYGVGLVAFHLFLLLTLPQIVGALAVQTTIFTELLVAAVLLVTVQRAVSGYARRVWMQGYATGHWDGLEDAEGGLT
jgi:hypothetical protein